MKIRPERLLKSMKIYEGEVFTFVKKYRRGDIVFAFLRNSHGSRVDVNIINVFKINILKV